MGEVELSVRTGKTLEESDSGSFQEEGRQFFWSLTAAPPKENPLLLPVSLTVRWNLGKQPYEYSVQTVFRLPHAQGCRHLLQHTLRVGLASLPRQSLR